MPCAIKNCKIKSNINPKTGLSTTCDQCFSGIGRKMQSQERQSVAREQKVAVVAVVIVVMRIASK